MHKAILTQVFLLIGFSFASAQFEWQQINSPVTDNFSSVYFSDSMNGWIVSETGSIISTSNAGTTWQTLQFPNWHLSSILFTDEEHGFIVGWEMLMADSSLILRTADGGNTWQEIIHVCVNRFNDVHFASDNFGWVVGSKEDLNKNCIYFTNDGGLSWSEQTGITILGAELFGVSFRDEFKGSACGTDGSLFITNNGGTSWAMGISMPVLNLNDIYNFGLLTGCLVGDEGTALFTTNNWNQYIDQNTGTDENLNAVTGPVESSFLWACGDNGTIIYNSNYLLPWASQVSNTSENLNDIQMLSAFEGWAVGDNGTIRYFNPFSGVENGVSPYKILISPNPTSGLITLEMDFISRIKVQVFDLQGKSIFLQELTSGNQIKIDLSGNPKGIYYIVASDASGKWTEKVVLN